MSKKLDAVLKNHPNFSNLEGKVGYVINESYTELSRIFEDEEVDDETFKEICLELINKAKADSYKRKCIYQIEQMNDRLSIMTKITNIMLKGDHLSVNEGME